MKQRLLLITLLVLVCAGSAFPSPVSALVTEQTWLFNSPDNPAIADNFFNPNGQPIATLNAIAGPHVPIPGWKQSWLGHAGVWAGDTVEATLDIPNYINQNPFKIIRAKVTFYGFLTDAAILEPQGGVTQLEQSVTVNGDGWKTLIAAWEIVPNPNFEKIFLRFVNSGSAIDDIFVSTECVPEPATMLLLGLGGLLLRRRTA